MKKKAPLIAFTGGGTGGHVYPGLAVIDELEREGFFAERRLCWFGSKRGMERGIVEARGIPFRALPAGKLRRYFSLRNLTDIFAVVLALFASFGMMVVDRPRLLFSKGGYVSVPPVVAARLLGIPVITHESDLDPGLATRLNARFATVVAVSYSATGDYFPENIRRKLVVTGNPIRPAMRGGDPVRGRTAFGLPGERPLILVLGGSLGAEEVNRMIAAIAPRLLEAAEILHQTGGGNRSSVTAAPGEGYVQREYIRDEMADVLAAAELVIGRAGAGTLWECGTLGRAMILIPLDATGSRGDQLRNAEFFRSRGAAEVLTGANLTPEALGALALELLSRPERRRDMGNAAREITGLSGGRELALLIRKLTDDSPGEPGA